MIIRSVGNTVEVKRKAKPQMEQEYLRHTNKGNRKGKPSKGDGVNMKYFKASGDKT